MKKPSERGWHPNWDWWFENFPPTEGELTLGELNVVWVERMRTLPYQGHGPSGGTNILLFATTVITDEEC